MDIAICEDNSTDCEIITSLLSMYFSDKSMTYKLELYENGTNLIYDFEEGRNFDIVFLDNYLKGQLGINVARKLRSIGYNGKIIFLSASSEFAVDSYDVSASGYLLKPHCYEKLCNVLDSILPDYNASTYLVHNRSNAVRIPYSEILFVESNNTKCILHRSNGESHIIYKKLDDIEKELSDVRFLRSHQSYLVNMDYICRADKHFELTTGDAVMIRQRDIKDIKKRYLEYAEKKISEEPSKQ